MTPRILKKSLLFIIAIILVLGLSVSFQSLLAAWTAPAANPPTCATGNPGCDAPLNVGPLIQPKSGALWLNTNDLSPYGLIVESGNVGIGTTGPGAKLEVAGQVKITGGTPGVNKVLTSDASGMATWQTPASFSEADTLQTVTTRGNTTNLGLIVNGQTINHQANNFLYVNSYDGLQLRINADGAGTSNFRINNSANNTVFTVKNDGNVGIGTTGPGAKLDVGGGGAGNILRIRGSNYNQVNIAATGNTGWGLLLTQSDATSNSNYHYSTSGNNLSAAIVNVNNDALHFGTNNATRMTINHDGNVGIGTARPSSGLKLDVEGKVGATKYCDQNGNNCKSGFTFYCENRPAQTGKTGDAVCAAWGGACVYMGDLGRGYADEWYNVRCNSGDNTGWGSGFRWRCCKVQ